MVGVFNDHHVTVYALQEILLGVDSHGGRRKCPPFEVMHDKSGRDMKKRRDN